MRAAMDALNALLALVDRHPVTVAYLIGACYLLLAISSGTPR